MLGRWRKEKGTYLIGQDGVGRNTAPTERRARTGPVGKDTTCLFDDWLHRRRIPGRHRAVDHRLGASRRDQQIAVTVTPRAGHQRAVAQTLPRDAARLVAAKTLTGRQNRRTFESIYFRYRAAGTVPPRALSTRGNDHLADRGA